MCKVLCSVCCLGVLSLLFGCGGGVLNNTNSSLGSGGSGGGTGGSGGTGGTGGSGGGTGGSGGGSGGSGGGSGQTNPPPPTTYQLTVQSAGSGEGSITSNPAGISCGTTCVATFPAGTVVTLAQAPGANSTFAGWGGACTGAAACSVTMTANATVSATFTVAAGIASINHVIILVQENRSLDNYLGTLREYWAENGFPDESFDGLPQFNPATGIAPLKGRAPSNPGCSSDSGGCSFDRSHTVTSFHLNTVCTENTSPSWNEAHNDWDPTDNTGRAAAKNDGFVFTAAYDGRALGYYDSDGIRAMGYYDSDQLDYLYFMASSFATSDRWFNPVMSRTNINREYLLGATSGGYAYPNGTSAADTPQLKSKTIFEDLQDAGITWKIYVNPEGSSCKGPVYTAKCLMTLSYLHNFVFADTVIVKYPQNITTTSQFFSDLENGTLPQVAEIEPASDAGEDEHGTDSDKDAPTNIQDGEYYVSQMVDAFMQSSSWSDSVLFWTYDEAGGLYDHVSPQPMPSPDGIRPKDLLPGDICKDDSGPTCDFTWTGYRVPLVVVSPYAKQHYVSHTVADYTAMLKFIETRWNLPPLTKRDAAQMDMTEFFDFDNPPWMTPPVPPTQIKGAACYLNHLP